MEEIYQQLLQDLGKADNELEKEIAGITDEAASKRILPGTWSMADCVAHLSMIDFSVLNIVRKVPDKTSELHKELTIIGRTKLRERLLDRSNKVKLPDSIESRMEQIPLQAAYEKLRTTRKLIRETINSGNIISPKMIFPHSVLGNMTKIDWLLTVPFHSLRHTEQIREVKSKLKEF